MVKSIFISSTSQDLPEYREAVRNAILRLDQRPIDMLYFGAQTGGATGVSLKEVGKADVFVGIVARRYGFVPEGQDSSVTEQEYDEALRRGIPRLMYLLDEKYPWPPERIEADETAQTRLATFRTKIEKTDVRSLFTTPDDLARQVTADLTKLLDNQRRQQLLLWSIAAIVAVFVLIALVLIADPGIRSDMIELAGLASPTPTPTATLTMTSTPTNTPTPTSTPMEGVPAAEGEVVVVVARFEQTSGTAYTPEIDMLEVLRQAAEDMKNVRIISIGHTIADREEAQHIADLYGATMVVYGRSAPGGVTAKYEITPRSDKPIYELEGDFRASAAEIENFDAFLYDGLDANYILGLTAGQLAYFKSDYETAERLFSKAENALNPARLAEVKAHILFVYQGDTYSQLGEYKVAVTDYSRAIDINPNLVEAYNNRGLAYAHLGEYEAAVTDYTHAIKNNPDLAEAYSNRGMTYYDQGQYEAAVTDFTRAIDIKPDLAEAYSNRGMTYHDQGQYEAAVTDFTRAIDIKPNFAEAYSNRGMTYYDQDQYDAAVTDFTRAIDIKPNFALAYNNRGNTFNTLGKYEAAVTDFTRAIDINPDHAKAYNNRGNIYFNQGEYEAALADYTHAIKNNPALAEAYNNRGTTYYNLGEYEAALADYTRAIEIKPDYAKAYHYRGNAHKQLGDMEQALTDWNSAITLQARTVQTVTFPADDASIKTALDEHGMQIHAAFTGLAGQRITLRISADDSAFDTIMLLRDADGKALAFNDDSDAGTYLSAIANFELPNDGLYTVVVAGYDGLNTGDFTLTLETLP